MQEADKASAVEALRKTDARIGELIGKVQGIQSEVAAMKRDLSGPRADGGNVTFTVNAGGVAVWIAALCALVAMVVLLIAVLMFVDLSRKVDRVTDYQTATYMIAPQLKPKEPQP